MAVGTIKRGRAARGGWREFIGIDEISVPRTNFFAEREDVVVAFLFGSTACGRHGAGSDIDIGILFADSDDVKGQERLFRRIEVAHALEDRLGVPVDVEILRQRLKLLEEYIRDLEQVQNTSLHECRENKILRRFVERTLQLAMEACLDVGSHVIFASGYRVPRFGQDVFPILAESGWLDRDLSDRVVGMTGVRNVLVHDYATLKDEIVLNVLQTRLPDLRASGTSIVQRLDQET